jgi:hypothetical protein
LAVKLVATSDKIEKLAENPDKLDLHSKSNMNLFSATVDDILEYFKLLSENSSALTSHLLKYGSYEECFYKWNERLRLIFVSLNMGG